MFACVYFIANGKTLQLTGFAKCGTIFECCALDPRKYSLELIKLSSHLVQIKLVSLRFSTVVTPYQYYQEQTTLTGLLVTTDKPNGIVQYK